jgi:hypothetical protein
MGIADRWRRIAWRTVQPVPRIRSWYSIGVLVVIMLGVGPPWPFLEGLIDRCRAYTQWWPHAGAHLALMFGILFFLLAWAAYRTQAELDSVTEAVPPNIELDQVHSLPATLPAPYRGGESTHWLFACADFVNRPLKLKSEARADAVAAELVFFLPDGTLALMEQFFGEWGNPRQLPYPPRFEPPAHPETRFDVHGHPQTLQLAFKLTKQAEFYIRPRRPGLAVVLRERQYVVRVRLQGVGVDPELHQSWIRLDNTETNLVPEPIDCPAWGNFTPTPSRP